VYACPEYVTPAPPSYAAVAFQAAAAQGVPEEVALALEDAPDGVAVMLNDDCVTLLEVPSLLEAGALLEVPALLEAGALLEATAPLEVPALLVVAALLELVTLLEAAALDMLADVADAEDPDSAGIVVITENGTDADAVVPAALDVVEAVLDAVDAGADSVLALELDADELTELDIEIDVDKLLELATADELDGAGAPPFSAALTALSNRSFAARHEPLPLNPMQALTIRLRRIPVHHAPKAAVLRARLLHNVRERRGRDVARARGGRGRGDADEDAHVLVRGLRARPRVPRGVVPRLCWRSAAAARVRGEGGAYVRVREVLHATEVVVCVRAA
jgi:hypothetical protein